MTNLLLTTDVYKFDHAVQYPEGTNKVYSYLCARKPSKSYGDHTVFFGLQYYIDKYLSKGITTEDVDEFKEISSSILGEGAIDYERYYALAELGYLPIEIKAVPEGSFVGTQNALVTITNTHPDFYWFVNYIETLLLKVWYPTTVATISNKYLRLCSKWAFRTCDNEEHLPFQIHDFGYRAVSSQESGEIGGAAHLLNFMGTDTTGGIKMLRDHYSGVYPIGLSVPASEHSVMCSWSTENDDKEAIRNMLDKYPSGIVSIVSDTYDLWEAIEFFASPKIKQKILERDGKVVVRPDSGDPEEIVPKVVQLLDQHFGHTVNSRGYKVLNPKIGCIYGDAIYYERAERIFQALSDLGYASSNVVLGIGGILLQGSSRDTFGFSLKATYCEVDGTPRPIMKDPVTDSGKKSHKGLLMLRRINDRFETWDEATPEQESVGELKSVFKDGKQLERFTLNGIRDTIKTDMLPFHKRFLKNAV